MHIDVFIYFLINLLQSALRTNPGQVQNDQLFGASLVSVESIEKVTSTQEQVHKYCNWRKESYLGSAALLLASAPTLSTLSSLLLYPKSKPISEVACA